jgi:glycosyltransferase involved in cell wall biosynthesis
MTRVAMIPSDLGACCAYRVAWPGKAVMDATGWDVELYHPQMVSLGIVNGDLVLKGIKSPDTLDLLVIQRPDLPVHVELINGLQKMGVAVVVDIDDAMWRIHPDNGAFEHWNMPVGGVRRYELSDRACALADRVTVSAEVLARRYGAHGRVDVLRNGLPNLAFAPATKPAGDRIKIGWPGRLASHPNDLQVMGDAVSRIIKENDDVDFHVVGEHEPVAELLGLPSDRVTGTGFVPLEEYHAALREIDIMVVPLADTLFNKAKSALKAQEGAAAGCVVLASATPENERLFSLNGFSGEVIQHGESWHQTLDDVLEIYRGGGWVGNRPERARFLAYENRAEEWAASWGEAIEHRKRGK